MLNPTLADGLWTWRQHLSEAAVVLSAIGPGRAVSAARELARDLARPGRTIVLAGLGATEPLFWHVPAGRELDTVQPDMVLLLVQNRFLPSVRLLLSTANRVFMLAGTGPDEQAESLKAMQMVVRYASPSEVEVVVIDEAAGVAKEASSPLLALANNRFGNRATWRHLAAERVTGQFEEEDDMASAKRGGAALSDTQVRSREWEESFRRAERLLAEAQETLQRQMALRSFPPPAKVEEGDGARRTA